MKNLKRTSLIALVLLWSLLLSVAASAAVAPPTTVEPQWDNINLIVCGFMVNGDVMTARGTIVGKGGTYVEATMTVYMVKNNTVTVIYTESTPEDYIFPSISFIYEFTPYDGDVIYQMVVDGVVSRNGIEETVHESDMIVFEDGELIS